MQTLTDLYLSFLIVLFLTIPVLTIIFCMRQEDLKFKKIFYSFSCLILILGLGIITNYDHILAALRASPMIGLMVFFSIVMTIINIVTSYEELITILTKNIIIWTNGPSPQTKRHHSTAPSIYPSLIKRIQNIIEYSPISILTLNEKLDLVGCNTAFLNFLGYQKEEVNNLGLMDIFSIPEGLEEDFSNALKEFRTGKKEFIQRLSKKNGDILYGKMFVYHIKDDNKAEDYHLVIQILDMTREVELQKKTRAFNKLLQKRVANQTQILNKKNRNLEYLNHAMSHDLKSPIKNLEGLFEIFLDLNQLSDKEDRQNCARHIQMNIKRMDSIITDLSLFFGTQHKEIHKTNYNPTNQIKEIIEICKYGLYSNLVIEVNLDKLPNIYADQGIVSHVWENLIINAIKYASKREKIKLHISGYKKEGKTIFSISDNGIGFSENEKSFLFKPFKRLSNSKGFKGTGLGLPIVKEIIERHGGEIWTESVENKGSTFYFSLPKKETTYWYGEGKYNDLLHEKGIEKEVTHLLKEIDDKEKIIFGKPIKK